MDDELRRLFADERLDLPVRHGAEQAIVSGAHRVRRRRIVLTTAGGAMAAAVLVGGGIAVAGIGGQQSLPPAVTSVTTTTTTPPSATTSTVSSSPVAPPSTGRASTPSTVPRSTTTARTSRRPGSVTIPLGPSGLGKLRLGMPLEQAMATGLIGDPEENGAGGQCTAHELSGYPTDPNSADVQISATAGVSVIHAQEGMRTPQGVGVGSTFDEVKAAYPEQIVDVTGKVITVPVPGNPDAVYYFVGYDAVSDVSDLRLSLKNHDCFD